MCLSWLPVKNLTTKGLTKCHLTSDNNKKWVSRNGVFAFGFLEIDSTNDLDVYVVGVKYNLGDKSANLPVWTVEGGIRVSSNSTFKLAIDGNLILMDSISKITMWSSNTLNSGVEKASLLDNGNFVLLGRKNKVIWESFGSPTNTLLPGQSLRHPQNLRALSMKSILSSYSLLITKSGELKLFWERNVSYWRSHFRSNEARFNSNGVFGLYSGSNNKAVWFVTSRDYEEPSVNLRHLRIDRDGNLRIYSWDDVGRAWKPVWQAVEDQCSVFASCGLYSICGYNSSGPFCECLDSGLLETGINGPGCKKMVDLGNCRMRPSIWAMKHTVLYGLYPSHDEEMLLSETSCKDFCTNDTSCIATTSMNDGSGLCTIKRTTFVSGYKNPYIHAVSFLKVCSVPQAAVAQGEPKASSGGATFEKGSSKKLIETIMLIALLTVLVILSIQFLVFSILYHKRKVKVRTRIPFGKDAKVDPHYSVLVRISFEEIKELTNNFANQVGSSVFRGEFQNKIPIVAKVLKDVVVLEKEFRVTVSTLSGTHHRNLASVKGFCFEAANKILLYEYVPNGSLGKWLFDTGKNHNGQIWQLKLDIALGIARGLAYLHTECQKCVTHGNLKLENVLLDENLVPKLTDYGLRDLQAKQNEDNSSSESPAERDIYELGQMFLQILTCKSEVAGESMRNILEMVNREEKKGDVEREILEAIERIARISFWCMQSQPFLRPSIGEVVKVLEGTLSVDQPPSYLATRRDFTTNEAGSEIEAECY
ncbi:hypothetical protein CASFOL_000546 [Castilleja foliolosa]|uniref:Receptor-like serine/threonine-protein kinase n=1 Tax=Castilleja foliolosa TaxID=1961234 RepID=A0ABD3ENS2_9LAMI